VRRLKLKSQAEWNAYSKSSKRPTDIPSAPRKTYAEVGWVGFSDWLGTGTTAPRLQDFRSFKKARKFVRSLKFKSGTEWQAYCKSGRKPPDIPSKPNSCYKNDGWAGMSDWLGCVRKRRERSDEAHSVVAKPRTTRSPLS